MELDRLVQVRLSVSGKPGADFGSGYLVAPRLVLTAAHILADEKGLKPGTVTVCRPAPYVPDPAAGQGAPAVGGIGLRHRATVRWHRKDEAVDAALVEIDDTPADDGTAWPVPESLRDSATRPPQRWGHLIGDRPHPVVLVGYPDMQYDPETKRSYDKQLNGHISPGSGSLARRYEISSTDPVLRSLLQQHPGTTGWSGMSGAAALTDRRSGSLLCGVTRYDLKADGGGTILTATPAATLLADPGFTNVLAEHTPNWQPLAEPAEPAHLLAPAVRDRDLRSPAALLRADTEAVPFHGRDHDLDQLHAWCTQGPPALSGQVLTGPGGQGKTRLARHLADALRGEGWITGHLRSDLTDRRTPDFTALDTDLPLLIVVDYAETRPRLLRDLIEHLRESRHRVRLLLLARSDGPWRTDSLSAGRETRDILRAAAVIKLAPLLVSGQESGDRAKAFTDAAAGLARFLPHVPALPFHDWAALAAGIRPPADIGHPRYNNALTLQMTALTTLLQHGPAPVTTHPGDPAEAVLLEHEERFWEDSAAAPAFALTPGTTVLKRAVAVAAACGAADHTKALHVVATVPALPPGTAPTAAEWLASLYPPDTGNRTYWGSLQPDRVAEYHASNVLTGPCTPLRALLAAAAPDQQAQLITVLARAVVAHHNARRTETSRQVLHDLNAALDTTTPHPDALLNAVAALPHPSHVLATLAVRLTSDLTHVQRDQTASEADLATSLSSLGIRLSEVGRWGEALEAELEAVEIRRRLADPITGNPAAYEPDLAHSLCNLGAFLSAVGRRAEALEPELEAVVIYRRLADPVIGNPAAHEPDLARSLSNLGTLLSEVGRRSEALEVELEAVEIRRRLADPATGNPAAHEPGLASSLTKLGIRLSAVGRRSEALGPELEAVAIRRRLADPVTGNPAAHEPDLARSLSNLGIRLSEVGRRSEALEAELEAVAIRRRLADPVTGIPAAYEPNLAASLHNLGIYLSELGRRSEALEAELEAVEIRRRLTDPATGNPAAHEADLAASLNSLGALLSEVGRRSEALEAELEAVVIYRRLADPVTGNPAAHEPGLAHSLTNLGTLLSEVGRRAEALEAELEAVVIYRRLADPVTGNPAAYEPDLAHSLCNLGAFLSEVGRWAEALGPELEAVEIRRRLADPATGNPAAHEDDLAASLNSLAVRLAAVGRRAEALEAIEGTVEIRRRLADPVTGNPAAHEPDLAASLNDLGALLSQVGRWAEALEAELEAVVIYRRLADPVTGNPAVHEPNFAASLSNFGALLSEAGRWAEALEAELEAVVIYRRLADPVTGNPAVHQPHLAALLNSLAIQLSAVGRRAEALEAIEQAVEIRRRLADPVTGNPAAAHEPDLAHSLYVWAALLFWGQQISGALQATNEAVEIYRKLMSARPAQHLILSPLRAVLSLQAEILDGLGRFQEAKAIRVWLAANPEPPDSSK
ncbi:tetratricopeptide repeat protein [Streptomyces sp. NPDC051366]|uniref:tetratricopeptide repeat protein n=1 Tax=Streptomyces sp. NPDC051366 TaxID=3365652 RepID=UPI0037A98892